MRARIGFGAVGCRTAVVVGGLSALLVACSDPTPPPAKGSVELHIPTNPSCMSNVMKAPAGITHPGADALVTDGDGGQVGCHVSSGSSHEFSGSLTYNAGDGVFSVSLSATIPETAISLATAVDGRISLYENHQLVTYSAPTAGTPACKFWLGDPTHTPGNDTAAFVGAHVTNGGIWGQVSCDEIVAEGRASDVCKLETSTFLFLDCSE